VKSSNPLDSSLDQNNNDDALKSSTGQKMPRPLDGGEGPTLSRSLVGDKRAMSASVDTDDRRRSWTTGQRAAWASFSGEDDEFAMYRMAKSDNAEQDADEVKVPLGSSKPPSLMTRSLSMVCRDPVSVYMFVRSHFTQLLIVLQVLASNLMLHTEPTSDVKNVAVTYLRR
jgi:hypothetical protein